MPSASLKYLLSNENPKEITTTTIPSWNCLSYTRTSKNFITLLNVIKILKNVLSVVKLEYCTYTHIHMYEDIYRYRGNCLNSAFDVCRRHDRSHYNIYSACKKKVFEFSSYVYMWLNTRFEESKLRCLSISMNSFKFFFNEFL